MTRLDPENGLDAQTKCYDNPAYDVSKTKDLLSLSAIPNTGNATLMKQKENTNPSTSRIQYRYIVTLFGFFVYFQIDCFRISTSMSVVKMVNSTAVNIEKNLNSSIDSCPFNNSVNTELLYPEVGGEFNWSPDIQGYVLSAGFFGYFVSQIPGGMLAQSFGAQKILFSGILISSLAHILCPFSAWANCYLMIAMQLIRGVGQGFLSPASSVIAAKWFPRQERGFLNSLIFLGIGMGSVITYATCGALCSIDFYGGWPLVYFVYGGLGLVFALCAHLFLYESPKEHPTIGKEELFYIIENQESDLSLKRPSTPWGKILTSVPVYVMTYSIFSFFWSNTQQLSEHPIFLANILHFDIETNGILNAIPFAFQILLISLGGWISKWLNTKRYVSVGMVRKGCTVLYSLGYSLGLLGMYFAGCDRVWSNVWSIIAFSFIGLSVPGCVIVPADMSPTFAGSLFAFSNTVATSASFIFPLIVGAMIDVEESLDQWNKIFILCIAVVMSSCVLFCLFGSAEIQPWNFPPTEELDEDKSKDVIVKNGTIEPTQSNDISTHL